MSGKLPKYQNNTISLHFVIKLFYFIIGSWVLRSAINFNNFTP